MTRLPALHPIPSQRLGNAELIRRGGRRHVLRQALRDDPWSGMVRHRKGHFSDVSAQGVRHR